MHVLVGVLIYRQGAYILDKFLANQVRISAENPSSEILIATTEPDFAKELESILRGWKLKGTVLVYATVKPDYANSTIWNIACGREAVRQYFLTRTDADGLLFLDADMTYDPKVINIMCDELKGYDAIFSGAPKKDFGIGLAGAGCVLIKREVLKKIRIRCYEFRNGEIIHEDTALEMDLFRSGDRVKKGFFVSMDHFISSTERKHIDPQSVGIIKGIANNVFLRYCLIRTSIIIHYNIPVHLMRLKKDIFHNFK